MSAYLAQTLKIWLETSATRAIDVERSAGLPNSTLSKIIAGTHPRPERLAQILAHVPDDIAVRLLNAYLLDDIPEDWRQRVTVTIQARSSRLMEPDTAPQKDRLTIALERFERTARGDPSFASWVTNTASVFFPDLSADK